MKRSLILIICAIFVLGILSCFGSRRSTRPVHDNNLKRKGCIEGCRTSKRDCIREADNLKRKGRRKASKKVCKEAKEKCVRKCRRRH